MSPTQQAAKQLEGWLETELGVCEGPVAPAGAGGVCNTGREQFLYGAVGTVLPTHSCPADPAGHQSAALCLLLSHLTPSLCYCTRTGSTEDGEHEAEIGGDFTYMDNKSSVSLDLGYFLPWT